MNKIAAYLSFFILLFSSLSTDAQDLIPQITKESDSTKVESRSITEVSMAFADIELKVDAIIKKQKNRKDDFATFKSADDIIEPISQEVAEYQKEDNSFKKTRLLNNELNFWKNKRSKVETQSGIVSTNIDELGAFISQLNELSSEVDKVYESLGSDNESYVIDRSKEKLKSKIEDGKDQIAKKRDAGLLALERCNSVNEKIVLSIGSIEDELEVRQTDVYSSRVKPIYSIDFFNLGNWRIEGSVINVLKSEFPYMWDYIKGHLDSFVKLFLVLFGLTYLFRYISQNYVRKGIGDLSVFKRYFVILLKKPFYLALIISLYGFSTLNTTLPVLMQDILRLILIIPITYLLSLIVDKKIYPVLILFALVIILYTIYLFLPEDKIPTRFLLATIAVIEIAAFLLIAKFTGGVSSFFRNPLVEKGVKIAIYAHAAAAFVALILGLFGMIHLSELLVSIVYGNVYVVILLGVLLFAVNGGVAMIMESSIPDSMNSIRANKIKLIKKITKIFNIVFLFALFYYLLIILGIQETVSERFFEWISKPRSIGSIKFSIGGIVTFFLVIYFSIYLSRIIKSLLEEDILAKMELETGLANTISTMSRYAIITIGVLFALRVGGLQLTEFAIVLSAFGVGIGFGLQNIFNNLVSGFILLFERPINIGDTVEVGSMIGNVKKIGIRSSNIQTFDGAEIIVPNGNLISNEVINWTLSDSTRRIELIVGVTYDADPKKVQRILMSTITNNPEIVKHPAPVVLFRDLGESSLDFRMLFWTTHFDEWIRIKSDVLFRVFDALKAEGIEIPFPQRDLHLRSIDSGVEFRGSTPKSD